MKGNRSAIHHLPIDHISAAITSADRQYEQNRETQENIKTFVPHLVPHGVHRDLYKVIHSHTLYIEQKHLRVSRVPSRLQ